jgi:glycine cleavage system T protein (aminomethyltransferase)
MAELFRTVFFDQHKSHNANIVEFAGWEMPIQYSDGISKEHMATREKAGIFDVSHMGRLFFSGKDALSFLQHVLTNNAQALVEGESQYTLIPNENGGAIDDAYLYRFKKEEYLLVVNASNREKVLAHFNSIIGDFPDVKMLDRTFEVSMISLQGPMSKIIVEKIMTKGVLPEPARNSLSVGEIDSFPVHIARTGYTGEPLAFEIFVENEKAPAIWDLLCENGGVPIGLGARDTLRLEACLPLYGHELGQDHDDIEIPIFASKLSKFAVSFSQLKGNFIGKKALLKQQDSLKKIIDQDFENTQSLPKIVLPVAIVGKGIAREGYKVFKDEKHVGYISSGTMVPYKKAVGSGLDSKFEEKTERRAIALALVENSIIDGDILEIEIRKKRCEAVVVPYHMSAEAPPYVRAISHDSLKLDSKDRKETAYKEKAGSLLLNAFNNNKWRQKECINLIPSEQSQSLLSRALSISDPVNRYAEHKEIKAFSCEDIFYYQGTALIEEVEILLNEEFKKYFNCKNVESRVVSGQMANAALFSALVDYINRADRKSEQRRISKIFNNHIIKGGHLSAQPMGALRDFVARDPNTERPAVVNFPVLQENQYKIDLEACVELFENHTPELIILGKSMVIHKEPVAEIRKLVDEYAPGCILMYDMAHVLGLYGKHFQSPLQEGAHVVTGSTHKTFFGTQRGVIASDFNEDELQYGLFEAVKRRTFPGSVSNHHLGTMVGLLFAAYEMNQFKDEYQKNIISNAKAFAKALFEEGLNVAGDKDISFTETHQVILNVGYSKGAQIAKQLEENNIIVNYQATPVEEGFTASGALRMGVSEMTRFGMKEADFKDLASLIADVVKNGSVVKDKVKSFRENFLEMKYCFNKDDFDGIAESLLASL